MMEYCLVPKAIADQMIKQTNFPNIQNSKIEDSLSTPKTMFSRPITDTGNPSLDHIVNLMVEDKHRGYALSVIKYLQDHPEVKYNTDGNFIAPVPGLNVSDVLGFFLNNKTSSFIKEKIKLMNDYIKIPPYYIKNKNSKEELYPRDEDRNQSRINGINRNIQIDRNETQTLPTLSTPPSTPKVTHQDIQVRESPSPRRRATRNKRKQIKKSPWSSY